MKSGIGLQTKASLGIIGIVVLLGLAVIVVVRPSLEQKLSVALQKRGISIANHIASNSIDPVLTEQYLDLEMMLKDFKGSEDDITYIFVLDNNGKVLAHTFENDFPLELIDVNKVASTQKYSLRSIAAGKEEIVDIAVPLLRGEAGFVHMGLSSARIKKDADSVIKMIIWLFMAILIVGAAMGNILLRMMTRPILELTEIAKAVGRGNLEQRVLVRSTDEIGELGTTFNNMIDSRKRAEGALQESEERYRSVVENVGIGIAVISPNMEILSLNKQMQKWFPGISVLDKTMCYSAFNAPPRETPCSYCPTCLTLNDGQLHEAITDTPAGDDVINYRVLSSPIKDQDGRVVAAIEMVEDITVRKKAEEQIRSSLIEKEILLKEIHHRVKNNLQVVASMLQLQSGYLKDEEAKVLFEESQKRLESMSLIHEKLYRSKDLARIDFREYVSDLVGNLLTLNTGKSKGIETKLDIEGVVLDVTNAIPCGLIINELVSNALRHAFPNGRKGEITVRMLSDSAGIALTVSDNGTGFPETIDFRNTKSLGMQLIISLVSQIDGMIELDRSEGTSFKIAFRT